MWLTYKNWNRLHRITGCCNWHIIYNMSPRNQSSMTTTMRINRKLKQNKIQSFFFSLFGLCPTRNFVLVNIFTVFIWPANYSIHSGRFALNIILRGISICISMSFELTKHGFGVVDLIRANTFRRHHGDPILRTTLLQHSYCRMYDGEKSIRDTEEWKGKATTTHAHKWSRRLGHAHTMFDRTTHVPFSFANV